MIWLFLLLIHIEPTPKKSWIRSNKILSLPCNYIEKKGLIRHPVKYFFAGAARNTNYKWALTVIKPWNKIRIDFFGVKGKSKQQMNDGVQSLRISKILKYIRFPADCVKNSCNSSQHIPKFKGSTRYNFWWEPAKIGRDNNNKTAVITTAQPNSANFI